MFNTIRTQLLFILVLFIAVTLAASITLFNYFEKSKDSLSGITQKAERIHLLLLQDINLSHDFIENETINPAFFSSGKSAINPQHESTWKMIDQELDALYDLQNKYKFGLGDSLAQIKSKLVMYKFFTQEIAKKVLIRGFKDYGVEGKMRTYAHELENYQEEIGLINILQLRRHEKDFIIRQEDPYIRKHQDLIKTVKESVEADKKLAPERKQQILKAITNYATEFDNLVMSEKMLGLKSNKGQKKQIDDISKEIANCLSALVDFSAKQEVVAVSNIRIVYLFTGIVFMLIALIASIFISRYVSRSIRDLQKEINEFVSSDFTKRSLHKTAKINNNEIALLKDNFAIMEQHIVDQMSSLKKTNQDLEMLFYVTSHDMRLPLLKVKEITTETIRHTNDVTLLDNLRQINSSWEQVITIVDELGLITNVKHTDIKAEEVDLNNLIRSVYSEFKGAANFDSLIFSLDIRTKSGLFSSPGLIKSIFRNLIDNSVKYSTKRSSFSFLKILVADQNEDMLRIEISDNGIGIRQEFHEQIFTMFFRGTEQAEGTGIGLYVAQCAIEKLHGAIGVESDGKSGTTFTLLLPKQYSDKTSRKNGFISTHTYPALMN